HGACRRTGSRGGYARDALEPRFAELARDELGLFAPARIDAYDVDLARDAFVERGEQIADSASGNHSQDVHLGFGGAARDPAAVVRGPGDQSRAVRAMAERVLRPAVVAALACEVLTARDVAQGRMRVVASGVDDRDAHAGAGQVVRLIEAHDALVPAHG